jgi:predicted transcriptional regulator
MSREKANIFGRQLVAARGLLSMTQAELAEAAGLYQQHVASIEAGTMKPRASTVAKLREAIESRGVEFTNGDNPGVRLKGDKVMPA